MKNLVGKVFGRLTVIRYVCQDKYRNIFWLCRCSCGTEKTIRSSSLVSGATKSCGCLLSEVTKSQNRKKRKANKHAFWNAGINSYKKGALYRGFTYELTDEEFISLCSKPCFYCGELPKEKAPLKSRKRGETEWNTQKIKANGIDRTNNTLGYTKDNCVPCCPRCNFSKHTMSKEEFLQHILKIVRHMNLYDDKLEKKQNAK